MTTTPTAWTAIKALFDATADLAPAQREAQLLASAATAAQRAEVRTLLAHHDSANGSPHFLSTPAARQLAATVPWIASTAASGDSAARKGQRLGAWQIVRALGAGGMGEVFEARRADGSFEGRAAVKLLKRGMDSAAVLQRFALERQALARLSHPHIARLLDAGVSLEGLPYFVLEFVDGRPIDEAVRSLPLQQRLQLFLQLADAVAHAHRNLLVHRDLKPGNVLVDAEGQVKLLDFGIAKALDPLEGRGSGPDIRNDDHATVGGVRPYTPHYASPEQIRGEPVSTATDVYSLGVLLYQMLTGIRPTGRKAATPQEAARGVLEEAPTPPSRLSPEQAADPLWLQHRHHLQGDLDNILLKALQKGVEQRYASVDALAADVLAYIDNRPVTARAQSPFYVLRKFALRNRWAVLAGLLGAVGLVFGLAASLMQGQLLTALGAAGLAAGLGLAMVQTRKATVARQQAEAHAQQLRRFSRELVVEYGDVITHLPGGREHKATMLGATAAYLERLLVSAESDLGLKAELALVCARLAHLRVDYEFNVKVDGEATARLARRAAVLCEAAEPVAAGDDNFYHWWSVALADLARVEQAGDQPGQALHSLQQADAVALRGLQRHPASVLLKRQCASVLLSKVYVLYGWDRPHLDQPQAALQQLQALQAHCQALADDPLPENQAYAADKLGNTASIRALILLRQQQWHAARDSALEAVQQRSRACALEPHNRTWHAGLVADRNLLAGLCLDVDDPAGALAASQPGWAALQQLTAEDPDNPLWLNQRRWLAFHHGRALLANGRPQPALSVLQVSADWLYELHAAGQATPRQQARLVRTWLAMVRAQRALALPGDGKPAWLQQAGELLACLSGSDEADVLKAQQEWAAAQAG